MDLQTLSAACEISDFQFKLIHDHSQENCFFYLINFLAIN